MSTRFVLYQLTGYILTRFPRRNGHFPVILPVSARRVRVQCRRRGMSDSSVGDHSDRFTCNEKEILNASVYFRCVFRASFVLGIRSRRRYFRSDAFSRLHFSVPTKNVVVLVLYQMKCEINAK